MKRIRLRTLLTTSLIICHGTQPLMAGPGEVWHKEQLVGEFTNAASKGSYEDALRMGIGRFSLVNDPLIKRIVLNMASAFFPLKAHLFSLTDDHAIRVLLALKDHFRIEPHTDEELRDLANTVADIFEVEARAEIPTQETPSAPSIAAQAAAVPPVGFVGRPLRRRVVAPVATGTSQPLPAAPDSTPRSAASVASRAAQEARDQARAQQEAADAELTASLQAEELAARPIRAANALQVTSTTNGERQPDSVRARYARRPIGADIPTGPQSRSADESDVELPDSAFVGDLPRKPAPSRGQVQRRQEHTQPSAITGSQTQTPYVDFTLLSTLHALATVPALDGLYRTFGNGNGTSLLTDDQWDMVAYGYIATLVAGVAYHLGDPRVLPENNLALPLSLTGLQGTVFCLQIEALKRNGTQSSIFPTWIEDFTPHLIMGIHGNQVLPGLFAPRTIAQAQAAAFLLNVAAPHLSPEKQQVANTVSWSTQFLVSVGSVFAKTRGFKNHRGAMGIATSGFFVFNIALDALSAAWAGTLAFLSFTKPTPEMTDAELDVSIAEAKALYEKASDDYASSKSSFNKELTPAYYKEFERAYEAYSDLLTIKNNRIKAKLAEAPKTLSALTMDQLVAQRNKFYHLTLLSEVNYKKSEKGPVAEAEAEELFKKWVEYHAEWKKYHSEIKSREAKK